MDIKIMAFEITLGDGISMDALYDHCSATSATPVGKRLLYINQKDGWWRGVMITAKNIKAFSRLIRDKGTVRLRPQEIQDGELAHFNYFLLNAKSQRGYFQYYHGSTSVHGFGDALKKKYNSLKEVLMAVACQKLETTTGAVPKHIKRQFSGYLQYEVVLRKKTFQELLKEFKYVKNITVQFKEYVPDQPLFRPLAEKAKSIQHRLVFSAKPDNYLLNNIIELALADVIQNMRGVGVADDNLDRKFKLLNEPETLDHFDFNDIVLETVFDSVDIGKSMDNAPIIQRLYDIANRDAWAAGE